MRGDDAESDKDPGAKRQEIVAAWFALCRGEEMACAHIDQRARR